MTQLLSYQIGGVLFVVTLILLASFCRDLIPREASDIAKKAGFVGLAVLLVFLIYQSSPRMHWRLPAWGPAVTETPAVVPAN